MTETSHTASSRVPPLSRFAVYGLSTGAGYALAAILIVAVRGDVPDVWGDVSLPLLMFVEIAGGLVGGLVVGLLAPVAKRRVGAAAILAVSLFPLIFAATGLVLGFSREHAVSAAVASVLLGVPLGLRYWADHFRHW